jgi:hypothetical protein
MERASYIKWRNIGTSSNINNNTCQTSFQYYTIDYRPRGEHEWTTIKVDGGIHELIIDNLHEQTEYEVRTRAHGAHGAGIMSDVFTTATSLKRGLNCVLIV